MGTSKVRARDMARFFLALIALLSLAGLSEAHGHGKKTVINRDHVSKVARKLIVYTENSTDPVQDAIDLAIAAVSGQEVCEEGDADCAFTTTADVMGDTDKMWLIMCGSFVFLMQMGFAMLEAGTVTDKSVQNILVKNGCDACLGAIIWWALGYAIAYDGDGGNGFIGGGDAGA